MTRRCVDSLMLPRLPSLCLEYGADEEDCERELEISERGMCFHSHWQFSPGTQVGVDVCYADASGEFKRARLEGIIVDCQPAADCQSAALKCYRATVLFLELPEAVLGTIRDVSSLLGAVRTPTEAEETLAAFIRRGKSW